MISVLSCCCAQPTEDRDVDVPFIQQKPLLQPARTQHIQHISKVEPVEDNVSNTVSNEGPKTFDAVLELTDGLQIGLGIVRAREKKALKIKAVQDVGAAVLWNTNHPEHQIERDCYIIQVNGVSGNTEDMIAECARSNFLVFKIQRF